MKQMHSPSLAALAAVSLIASCSSYEEGPPPYYQPVYGRAGTERLEPDSRRKIENNVPSGDRQFGMNQAPDQGSDVARNLNGQGGYQNSGDEAPGLDGGPSSGPAQGIMVPNRPGMIMSPYARDPNKLIDVSGVPSGTLIRCPYSEGNRTIRVP